MEVLLRILFFLSGFIIFWAMIGYPLSIKFLGKVYKNKKEKKNYSIEPTVTIIVTAHNEEKVIEEKLHNLCKLNYPKEKLSIIVASDHSNDKTNDIVKNFIDKNKRNTISLFEVKSRKGKTNAQNEAQKTVLTEYLVMTDANSMLDENAVKELMASFTSDDIAYVTGRLTFVNDKESDVSTAEASYWDSDTAIREIESNIQTITAGNGALYACRNNEYYNFKPIESHDSAMPIYYALQGKRAIANHAALAYEKAGEVIEDEYKRKVRMNRRILQHILPSFKLLNIFKYKWFTYFYFGHRTSRYLLWLNHLIIFVANCLLLESIFFVITMSIQLVFYIVALLRSLFGIHNKYVNLIYYYCVTILAQFNGVLNIITGKAKPFWEKAESTR